MHSFLARLWHISWVVMSSGLYEICTDLYKHSSYSLNLIYNASILERVQHIIVEIN